MMIHQLQQILRFSYVQWRQNLLCMMALSLGFCMILLVHGIEKSAYSKIKTALKSVNPQQLVISHHGIQLSPANSRLVMNHLKNELHPHSIDPLYLQHAQVDWKHQTLAVAVVNASERAMKNLYLIPPHMIIPNNAQIAWTNQSWQKLVDGAPFPLEHKTYTLISGLNELNIALQIILQAKQIIWIPKATQHLNQLVSPTHFIVSGITPDQMATLNLRQLERQLTSISPGQSWEIEIPSKLMQQSMALNGHLMFYLWLISLITILSGCINLCHLLIQNVKVRKHEIALRVMLGARGLHLFIQFSMECLLLAYFCLGIGLIASMILGSILHMLSIVDINIMRNLSPTLFGFITLLSLIIAIYPALLAIRTNPRQLFNGT